MPSLPLIIRPLALTQRKGEPDEVEFPGGDLPLSTPHVDPPLSRVRVFRLVCNFRVQPVPGAWEAILDTGAPLSVVPRSLWRDQFRWREGVHFDVCDIAGLGRLVEAQLLNCSFRCRVVRLRVPVEFASPDPTASRFRVENLIAQLPESETPKHTVLGLWGGVFEGRRLFVERRAGSDDLAARFEW